MAENKAEEAKAPEAEAPKPEAKSEKAKAPKGTKGAKGAKAPKAKAAPEGKADAYVPRLKTLYVDTVRGELAEQFNLTNPMTVPTIEKIVVNMGVGEAATDPKAIDGAIEDLRVITGQQPLVTRARKSIATFKLRTGMRIGAKVTLRGNRMWDFLDRLIAVAIPRIRDFRGVSPKSFDGRGNFSMGVTEQTIFPEIDYDKMDRVRGMDITIVTTAPTDEQGRALLAGFGFPFKRD